MLYEGRCAMTEFPPDRFNIDAFYDKENSGTGTLPLRGGHFLKEDLGAFDAPFFSVTPAEAVAMDPQQRIMLETSYHALENAGLTIDKCSGSKTSVYTATFTDDYKSMLQQDPEQLPKYAATGLSGSMLANRVSWFFNLRGPSMNLDSACSSSLSALHVACQDLLNGTSKMALVGGCNLVFHPDFMLIMSNMSFMSPDSRCWSFDHRANGYARGDGFGVVVLKKLSDALQDGDTIRAVIRATGLNQDGRTTGGITQPNGEAQQLLINETFTRANLDMAPVRFFEAHGTGTALGDPTEAKAIGNSFRSYRSAEEPLIVGAVKSNIGHLEGGSGIAGLIKTVMILEKGIILPNTGLEKVNPRIDTQNLRIHSNAMA
ncbi:Reducing polyketide synthase [Lachnellula subtilissima]|uniref:Reducing polyketide synthase n=1 Tax=Lachnellula subtilissima TaxID=602034 RepID=A0A8H8UCI3_9HELO|nr:Reducing polyketide synthase [Lachnellula subtilissima]